MSFAEIYILKVMGSFAEVWIADWKTVKGLLSIQGTMIYNPFLLSYSNRFILTGLSGINVEG